jgi:hypothetical protein
MDEKINNSKTDWNSKKKNFDPRNNWNSELELLGIFRNTHGNFDYNNEGSLYFIISINNIAFSVSHFHLDIFKSIPDDNFIIGFLYSYGDIQFMVTGKTDKNESKKDGIKREIQEELGKNYNIIDGLNIEEKRADPDDNPIISDNDNKLRMTNIILNYPIIKKISANQNKSANRNKKRTKKHTGDKVGSYLFVNNKDDIVNLFENLERCSSKTDTGIVGVCAVKVKLIKNKIVEMFSNSTYQLESKADSR